MWRVDCLGGRVARRRGRVGCRRGRVGCWRRRIDWLSCGWWAAGRRGGGANSWRGWCVDLPDGRVDRQRGRVAHRRGRVAHLRLDRQCGRVAHRVVESPSGVRGSTVSVGESPSGVGESAACVGDSAGCGGELVAWKAESAACGGGRSPAWASRPPVRPNRLLAGASQLLAWMSWLVALWVGWLCRSGGSRWLTARFTAKGGAPGVSTSPAGESSLCVDESAGRVVGPRVWAARTPRRRPVLCVDFPGGRVDPPRRQDGRPRASGWRVDPWRPRVDSPRSGQVPGCSNGSRCPSTANGRGSPANR